MAITTWTTVNSYEDPAYAVVSGHNASEYSVVNAEQNPGYAVINTIIWNVEVDSGLLLANGGFFLTSEGEFFIVGAA